jgi:hypothetical protein
MLEIWKEVERSEQAVAEAETPQEYEQALKGLERVLRRYTEQVQECLEQVAAKTAEPRGTSGR